MAARIKGRPHQQVAGRFEMRSIRRSRIGEAANRERRFFDPRRNRRGTNNRHGRSMANDRSLLESRNDPSRELQEPNANGGGSRSAWPKDRPFSRRANTRHVRAAGTSPARRAARCRGSSVLSRWAAWGFQAGKRLTSRRSFVSLQYNHHLRRATMSVASLTNDASKTAAKTP